MTPEDLIYKWIEIFNTMDADKLTELYEGSDSSPTGYLEGLYVKPEFRKTGIAGKLFLEGEKWFKAKGCRQIGSDAYIDNKISYDFHPSIGFKDAGKIPDL